jgi:hypothetical protein
MAKRGMTNGQDVPVAVLVVYLYKDQSLNDGAAILPKARREVSLSPWLAVDPDMDAQKELWDRAHIITRRRDVERPVRRTTAQKRLVSSAIWHMRSRGLSVPTLPQ